MPAAKSPDDPVRAIDATEPPELTYEEARDELVDVVAKLETGTATLDESLALWERAEKLAAICTQWLDGARRRLAAYDATPGGGDAGES